MKNKQKKYNSEKVFEKLRREEEIKTFGKILSLRPSVIHDNKKKYKRNKKVDLNDEE